MYIKNLTVKGESYENIPASIEALTELGLSEAEAAQVISDEDARLRPSRMKSLIQKQVSERYGVNGNPVSAALSIIGKIGDATSLSIDSMVHDIIAISETESTDYSQSRVRLFKEIHGEDSWASAVEFANQWHAGRKDKSIAMPFDAKGIAEVVTESADLGGFVKAAIAAVNAQAQSTN